MTADKKKPLLWSGVIGVALVAVGLLVNLSGPDRSNSLPQGFLTPVIAFEFADSDDAIREIFGPLLSTERQELFRSLTSSTKLDFAFLILYGAFLLSFALVAVRQTGNKRYYAAALLAVIAPVFDVLENGQLLAIMQQLADGETQFELAPLQLYTWAKWGSLALGFGIFSPFFWRSGAYGRFMSVFAFVPMTLGIVAYFRPGLLNEFFAVTTVMMFLLMIVFAFIYEPEIQAAQPL